MRVLLATVGGSDVPIVQSIQTLRPNLIFFICSSESRITVEGDGLVCADSGHKNAPKIRPNILIQADYPKEQCRIIEVNPDDPYATYFEAKRIIKEYERHQVYCNYTGGTKSMTAGLFAASIEFDYCQTVLVKGPRVDLDKVKGDVSRVEILARNMILRNRYMNTFREMFEKQDYSAALSILDLLMVLGEDSKFLDRATYLTRAFSCWDEFQYEQAHTNFEIYCKYSRPSQEIIAYKSTARKLKTTMDTLTKDQSKDISSKQLAECNMLVYEIVRNAERRARFQQYDDAVARLYRATEMYAQMALFRIGIVTANVDDAKLAVLPAERREHYERRRNPNGVIQIGLRDSYDLLEDLQQPVGEVWSRYKNKILHVIQSRNNSFLAHGFTPVKKQDYDAFHDTLCEFIRECDTHDPILVKYRINLDAYQDLPTTYPAEEVSD